MADEVVVGNQQQEPLGWRAGLPAELKEHESLKPYKTVGEFAQAHLATATKASELEGKLANSIPKLGENATPEEREQFFTQLGRPGKPEEYEIEGAKENATEWTDQWKGEFHKLGLTKEQAKGLSGAFNTRIQAMVEAHNANIGKMNVEAETTLKSELGDKYPASLELANRLWKKVNSKGLDESFKGESSAARVEIMRYILDVARKTGEDASLRGSGPVAKKQDGMVFDKSPAPPQRAFQ